MTCQWQTVSGDFGSITAGRFRLQNFRFSILLAHQVHMTLTVTLLETLVVLAGNVLY